jgi:pimeloyl-ACP methyl ester carboxylesterase
MKLVTSLLVSLGLVFMVGCDMKNEEGVGQMEDRVPDLRTTMSDVTSKDGTRIAFDKIGTGPAIIIVNGALSHRNLYGDKPLAAKLAEHFTVYTYDRRGRGESTDTQPYAVGREIEDIEALITNAGGSAYLYGVSSGAALTLHAAARLSKAKVPKVVLYEPPYGSDDIKDKQNFARQKARVGELLKMGQPGDAVAFFMSELGTPPKAIEDMKGSPEWEAMKRVEHTLAYDFAILDEGAAGAVPVDIAKAATTPALVVDGENTMEFMHATADRLAEVMPHAERKTLKGQTHEVSPEAIAPLLIEFFQGKQKKRAMESPN